MEDACNNKKENDAYRACVKKHHRNDDKGRDEEAPDRIIWPFLTADSTEKKQFETEVCERFMRHFKYAPGHHSEMKILSSIHFVADLLDCCDAHIAKILVENGLRAPRSAFPSCFLEFADSVLKRAPEEIEALAPTFQALKNHWETIGEDKQFNRFEYIHTLIIQGDFCTHA